MGKPRAPEPPNYAAAALAQGAAEKDTATFNAGINRPTEIDNWGTRSWQLRPGADPKNPKPGDYIVETYLNSDEENLLNQQRRISAQFGTTAEDSLGRVRQMMSRGLDLRGVPGLQTAPGVQQVSPTGSPGVPGLQTGLSTAGLPEIAGNSDATRQRVEQALLSRMLPRLDEQRRATETGLQTSGLDIGSAARDVEMRRLDQARNDALASAILMGGQEESRLLGDQRATRGQLFDERLTSGQFGNDAQQALFGMGLARSNTDFGQRLAASGQNFQQGLSKAGFNNTARSQAIQELLTQRQLPLNEANALRTGVQVGQFNPAQFYTPQAGAAPMFDAAMAQGGADQAAYQGQLAGYNALLGGLAGLGTAGIFKYSDRRLKSNIKPKGQKWGFNWYEWDWVDGSGHAEGVIADEVEGVMPEAVVQVGDYKGVSYSMLQKAWELNNGGRLQ